MPEENSKGATYTASAPDGDVSVDIDDYMLIMQQRDAAQVSLEGALGNIRQMSCVIGKIQGMMDLLDVPKMDQGHPLPWDNVIQRMSWLSKEYNHLRNLAANQEAYRKLSR